MLAIDLTPSNSSDELLLIRIGEGDSEAFWRLWQTHEAVVDRICNDAFQKGSMEAEDAYAAIRLKALAKLQSQANSVRNVRAWLIGLARNHCTDLHRKKLPLSPPNTLALVHMPEPEYQPSPAVIAWFKHLDHILQSLSPALREGLLTRFQSGQNYRDLAATLKVSEAALRKRVQRARDRLAKELGEKAGIELEDLLNYVSTQREAVVDLTLVKRQSSRERVPTPTTVVGIIAHSEQGARDLFLPSNHRPGTLGPKIRKFENYLQDHPNALRMKAELAHLHLLIGNIDAADRGIKSCLGRHDSQLFRIDQALIALAKDPGKTPESNQLPPSTLAAILTETRDVDAALRLATLNPEPDPVTSAFLSRCLRRAGHIQKAESLALSAHTADPRSPLARIEVDLHRIRQGKTTGPAGRRTFNIALNLTQELPHLGQATILLALTHLARGQAAQAAQAIDRHIEREPTHGQLILAHIVLSILADDRAAAMKMLQGARAKIPASPDVALASALLSQPLPNIAAHDLFATVLFS